MARKQTNTDRWKERAKHYADDVDRRTVSGLMKVALLLKRESQQAVPVRTGNLRAGAFIVIDAKPLGQLPGFKGEQAGQRAMEHGRALVKTSARTAPRPEKHRAGVGYSSLYALAVHENDDAGAKGFKAVLADTKVRRRKTGRLSKKRVEERHSAVGGSKFLENPAKQGIPRFRNIMKRETQKAQVK